MREVYKKFLYCKYSLMRPVVRECMRNSCIISTQSYGSSKNPNTTITYIPSSPCMSRELVTVAFQTLHHHSSKWPSTLLKLMMGVFTPVASTDA